ncbi:MAG: GNAT family N-acetyltransferase, partial [Planctomycetota bacterium]
AIPRCPEGARVVISNWCLSSNASAKALFESLGMELIRHGRRMEIEFSGPPAAPQWPAGIICRTYRHDEDLRAVFLVEHEAFRDHWGHVAESEEVGIEQLRHFIESDKKSDPSLWFLAMDDEEVVGICRCNPEFEEDPEFGFVWSLGVRRRWRRRGIGLAILRYAFCEFYRRGKKGVCLDVDAGSLTGANRLYEKAGMHIKRQSDVYMKELRPGKDLMTHDV